MVSFKPSTTVYDNGHEPRLYSANVTQLRSLYNMHVDKYICPVSDVTDMSVKYTVKLVAMHNYAISLT